MTDLIKKFSEAAKTVSSKKDPMRECVYGAYHNHLSDINSEILPEDIQIISSLQAHLSLCRLWENSQAEER